MGDEKQIRRAMQAQEKRMVGIRDGDPVWYSPIFGMDERYAGTVEGTPRMLGSRLVVNVRDMEPSYSEHCGHGRNRVIAASLSNLERRDAVASSPASEGGTGG